MNTPVDNNTMDVDSLFEFALQITERINTHSNLKGYCRVYINYYGDKLVIEVSASEPYSVEGYWSRSKAFTLERNNYKWLESEVETWVATIPSEEDRLAEVMVQKLVKLADQLPKGSSEIAQTAWKSVHDMLLQKAKKIGKNALVSPEVSRDIENSKKVRVDEEMPF